MKLVIVCLAIVLTLLHHMVTYLDILLYRLPHSNEVILCSEPVFANLVNDTFDESVQWRHSCFLCACGQGRHILCVS